MAKSNKKQTLPQHFVRLVLPLTFNASLLETLAKQITSATVARCRTEKEAIDNEKIWESFTRKETNAFFLPHIEEFLKGIDPKSYLYRWRMAFQSRSFLFDFHQRRWTLTASFGKNFKQEFTIQEVELYLFKSGVGFLILECEAYKLKTMKELIQFNYYMRYAGSYSASIQFTQRKAGIKSLEQLSNKREGYLEKLNVSVIPTGITDLHQYTVKNEQVEFTKQVKFSLLLKGILELIFENSKDFKQDFIGPNLQVYTYFRTGSLSEAERVQGLFHLRRVLKESFRPTKADISPNSPEIINTYDNIYFGISLEGSVILAEDDGHPFLEDFGHRIRQGYFIIYLLALHNRMALLNFRTSIEQIFPPDLTDFQLDKTLMNRIRQLRNQALSFYLKSYFVQITNCTAYESVYQLYHEIFFTKTLLHEIKEKTLELDEFITIDLERKSNHLINIITFLGFIIAPISIATGIFGINVATNHAISPTQFLFPWEIATFAIGGLFLSAVFLFYVLFRKAR